MNKTVTINLNGIIFHIDENAYEILSNYLATLRHHFSQTEGKDEIINDIEARIAEIFQTKINDKKQVIRVDEVNEVINILGRPENFEDAEKEKSTKDYTGTGEYNGKRKLYRDPDNKVLGGVCSGLGHYFDVEAVWFRLAFVFALLFFGSGTLLYIILWLVIPKANTTSEKLEMKGERINISNIEKNIKEEFEDLKQRFQEFGKDAKTKTKEEFDNFKKNINNPKNSRNSENIIHRLVNAFVTIVEYFVKAVIIFVGIILTIVGFAILIPLILSLVGVQGIFFSHSMLNSFSLYDLSNLFIYNNHLTPLAIIGLILLLGIPLIMLIYNGIRLIFGIRRRIKLVSITALCLWLIGIIICAYISINTVHSFREKVSYKQTISFTQPAKGVLYIDVKNKADFDIFEDGSRDNFELDNYFVTMKNNSLHSFGVPVLKIVKNDSNRFEMEIIKSSRGMSARDARYKTNKISYTLSQKDSVLTLDDCFYLPKGEKWRNQNVKIILKVPVGKTIIFKRNIENMTCWDDNVDDVLCSDNVNKKIIMTESGLKCIDCKEIISVEHEHHHRKFEYKN